MGNRRQKKAVERVKTRKELRKDKRLQKKANRVHFQKRKKELKLEYKERLKQKKLGNKGKTNGKSKTDEKVLNEEHEYDDFDMEGDTNEFAGGDDEIESDFELSDEELEKKTNAMSKQHKPAPRQPTQLEMDHQRLLKQEQSLRKDMGKQRIKQLKLANEDEDKTISKLEKLLKIDKGKSKKSVPRMFNDGLDYALEMCLPENIEKMYTAAKEAADAEHDSDGEWQEDFALATGEEKEETSQKKAIKTEGVKKTQKEDSEKKAKVKLVNEKKMRRLRKIESKYFDDSDGLGSDLSDVDSEFGFNKDNDSENEDQIAGSDFEGSDYLEEEEGEEEGSISFDEDMEEEQSLEESDDEAPEEVSTVSKSSKKRQLEKSKKAEQQPKKKAKMDESEDEEGSFGFSDEETDDEPETKSNGKNAKKPAPDDLDSDEFSGDEDVESGATDEKPEVWEDIYGRKRDKDGNVITETKANETESITGKYIPPHLRARMAAESNGDTEMDAKRKEKLLRLKKILKGYMNRLSEANMHKIMTDIDNLYMQNSRHDMNNTLATLICDALISHTLAPERMVMEHALLVAALHANVGTEVGAHFLEVLIDRLNKMLNAGIEQYDVEDKTLDNIVFLLCHLYTFKIFQHKLVYEILNKLIDKFCEKSVECLLLALRSVGFALRKDDPAALKELITTIQKKTSEASAELKSNARLKYMLDVLTAIKNNNVNRIPNYDPALAEHLRKILKSLCVNGKYVTTLNIALDDLLNVQNRGKWWVVGSAWSGNISDISGASKAISNKKSEQKFSEQLLQLARKQRMNTDERRNAFCVLMSAEDFIDAFEKLLGLAIKDQRTIVSVIIHCCLSEKAFNPYYAVVAQKFCDYDRKYQLAVQYALWDRIKDVQSLKAFQSKNLAQFIIHLITNAALPLSVLKVIEFGELEKLTLRLVRQILLGILLGKEETCKEVFQRIAPSAKLKAFKDSIRLFMHHFLLKGSVKNGVAEDKLDLLRERIKIADKHLDLSAIRF